MRRLPFLMFQRGERYEYCIDCRAGICAFVRKRVCPVGAVFVMSMLPFIENKGAIILAAALKLKWYLTYLLTCIGSYLPVPLLLRMKKHPLGQKETSPRLLRNAHQALEKHEAQLKKYGPPALFVCVCIPFTGVGCWIGSMLARLTDMDERRAGLAIFGGTLVSGVLTILGVYGLVGGLQYLLR